ncbi:MAG: M48 family metallopeptidase, partial [Deltaproteobacteria bacterium]|nr:M48 family metallopeptidase [Deltaproteobacteria bacterium]
MIEVAGLLHDGCTSRTLDATLRVYDDGTARLTAGGAEQNLVFADLAIPQRLGNTTRRVGLPDGGQFETRDNDRIDSILDIHGSERHGWLHRLESRWGIVVLAAATAILAGGLFAVKGIPALARTAAFATSAETNALLARGTLELLDQSFEPSELPEPRKQALRAAFDGIVVDASEGYAFELLFRTGGLVGANAFALPSGTVIVTDELVELAERDEEIVAVLAHEVGHVVHRHGLRQAIQDSLLAVGIVLVVGDLSAASGLVAALPTALAEASFSRDFEREADEHALAWLEFHGIDPVHLVHLLQRMEAEQGGGFDISFLSTHPATDERIE